MEGVHYGGSSTTKNTERIAQLKHEIETCKQHGVSMEAYIAKMTSLWQELVPLYEQLIPANSCCDPYNVKPCKCKRFLYMIWESEEAHHLLRNLDDAVFDDVRSDLLAMDPLPSLDQMHSILVEEEVARNPFSKLPKRVMGEILMRLTPRPLFSFKGVLARYESFIMDPEFARKYMKQSSFSEPSLVQLRRMLHPIMKKASRDKDSRLVSVREPVHIPTPHDDHMHHHVLLITTTREAYSWCPRILASSNGLVLSQLGSFHLGSESSITHTEIALFVSNPLTNESFALPRLDLVITPRAQWTFGFATRGDTETTNGSYKVGYKVVFAQRPWRWDTRSESVIIKIFSSDSGSWVDVVVSEIITCPQVVFRNFLHGPDFCWKGILHWIDDSDTRRAIVTYDPYDSPDRFGHIPLPNASNVGSAGNKFVSLSHLDHEDFLKCCEIERSSSGDDDLSLLVWRLVDYGKGEWCLEQRCRISSLCGGVEGGLLKGCRQVIASDHCNPEPSRFCYLFAKGERIVVVDLVSGTEENVNVAEVSVRVRQAFDRLPLVPYVYCPWSSPFPDDRKKIARRGSYQGGLEPFFLC